MSNLLAASVPIFLAVPAFRGWDLIPETLRSIRDQTFQEYRVLISVDGADMRTADVCRTYAEQDPCLEVVVQPERLGWAANLNWLMAQCDGEFFCYWQQDDICAINYLETLHSRLSQRPEAACTYCDVQWFGARFGRESLPSITGTPLERVMMQVEKGHFAPFRGLIRTSAIRAAGPIRVTQYDSRLEDLPWIARVAAQGELLRVEETLYFKRVHNSNVHSTVVSLPKEFRRAVWIEYGIGMLEAALPLTPMEDAGRLLQVILERLLLSRENRWLFYDPSEDSQTGFASFANDFLDSAIERLGVASWQRVARLPDAVAFAELMAVRPRGASECPSENSLLSAVLQSSRFRDMQESALHAGRLEEQFTRNSAGASLLQRGWASPEEWGVWSSHRSARLLLPVPADGFSWLVSLRGHAFVGGPPDRVCRIVLRLGEEFVGDFSCTQLNEGMTAEFRVTRSFDAEPVTLDIDLPDAASPSELGVSSDGRLLGLGLTSFRITRQSAAV